MTPSAPSPIPVAQQTRPVPGDLLVVVGFVLLYAVAAALGRLSRVDGTPLALVWPAAAVGYLWLLWSARRGALLRDVLALGLTAGAMNAATGASLTLAAAFAVANPVQALVAVLVTERVAGGWRLRTSRDLAALVVGSVVGAAAGALVGTAAMSVLLDVDLPSTYAAWVVRNASNTFVFAAVGIRVADLGWRSLGSGRRAAEWAGTVAAVVVVYLLVFGHGEPVPVTFLVMPLSVWLALRFSTTAAAAYVLLAGTLVVGATAAGLGPFSAEPVALRVALAQAFVATVGLVVLVLALHRDERERLVSELTAESDQHASHNALLESVLATVDVAVVACDADGRLTLFNRAANDFHGSTADPTLDPTRWAATFDLYEEDGRTLLTPERIPLAAALRDGQVCEQVIVIAPHGLPARTVRVAGRRMLGPGGRVLGAVVAQTDITRLQASEREFRNAFISGPTPSALLAGDGTIEQVNPSLRRLLGLPDETLLGCPIQALVPADHQDALHALLRGDQTGPIEICVLRVDGSAVWCEVSATDFTACFGEAAGAATDKPGHLVQIVDVHVRRAREQRLELAAQRDPLTGLANRAVANTRIAELSEQGPHQRAVLAYLDLDGFKSVNDTHGHSAGDAVLLATAARLQHAVRAGDEVIRLGGDEFLLICPINVTAPAGPSEVAQVAATVAEELAERVEALLSQPVQHGGVEVTVGASVGTLVAHGGEDVADLLTRADQAMYERKRARRNGPDAPPRTGPEAERRRLQTLHGLDVLDTAPDPVLDEIVRVAALAAGVPTALVSLVDENRQWFKARCDFDLQQTRRDVSFCTYVVDADSELHVHDATRDPRFAGSPLVTDAPRIRSYAGFPLRTADGEVLGSLCVIGYRPGTLDDAQRQMLRILASQVAARLVQLGSGDGTAPEHASATTGPGAAGLQGQEPAHSLDAPLPA